MAMAETFDRANDAGRSADPEAAFMEMADRMIEADSPPEREEEPAVADNPPPESGTDGDVEAAEPEAEASDDEAQSNDEPEAEAEGESEEQEVDGDEPEEYLTLNLDGEEIKITPDQYADGYLRQQDYSRKTAALTKERDDFAAQQQQFAQWMNDQVQAIQQFAEPELDWETLRAEMDPIEYLELKEGYEARQKQRNELVQQHQAQNVELVRQQAHEGYRSLVRDFPEWEDPSKFNTDLKAYRDLAAAEHGFTEQELVEINDPRVVRLLRDYHALKTQTQKASAVVKRVQKAPKISGSTSGTANKSAKGHSNQRRAALMTNLKKAGGSQDAALPVFLDMVEEE